MSTTQNTLSSETPFDIIALENQVRETLALSGIDYDALKLSLPAQPPVPVLGGSGTGLVGINQYLYCVIPGPVVKIRIGRFVQVNLSIAHLTKPSGMWFRYCDVMSRHGEFLGRRTS